jgi:hypothetical protein
MLAIKKEYALKLKACLLTPTRYLTNCQWLKVSTEYVCKYDCECQKNTMLYQYFGNYDYTTIRNKN